MNPRRALIATLALSLATPAFAWPGSNADKIAKKIAKKAHKAQTLAPIIERNRNKILEKLHQMQPPAAEKVVPTKNGIVNTGLELTIKPFIPA